jgi:predicted nucleotidyltransferase
MRRDQALAILRAHEAELRASGVLHLRLFGSVARDEATDTSDIDVLAYFDPNQRLSLWTLGGLQQQLVELLGRDVDLVRESRLLGRVRERALNEAVLAF